MRGTMYRNLTIGLTISLIAILCAAAFMMASSDDLRVVNAAMKGDREKCIEAGASDYITKPLKIDQLLSLMRVWLYK